MKELILAIAMIESSMNPLAIGDNGASVGLLQISEPCLQDVNNFRDRNYTSEDRKDPQKSIEIFVLYIDILLPKAKEEGASMYQSDEEIISRIWNGGPRGWNKSATKIYWDKVRKELK
jgi:membrane-bound lytic murein transglycosylase MltF